MGSGESLFGRGTCFIEARKNQDKDGNRTNYESIRKLKKGKTVGLKKDIVLVSISNLVVLLSSLVNGFLLPAFLSIEAYADIKTYTLFASFIGFVHLGLVDGINIRYGGKYYENVPRDEFAFVFKVFAFIQIIATLIVLSIGLLTKNIILVFVGLTILPLNAKSFYLFFLQALGDFGKYTKLIIIAPIINIVLTTALLFSGIQDYRIYILVNIAGQLFSLPYLWRLSKRSNLGGPSFSDTGAKKVILLILKSGFYIMIGNLLFTIFFDTGRWLSKLLLTNTEFAIYSFGMSLIGFITIFINSVTQSLYPHLSRNFSSDLVGKYRNFSYVLGSLSFLGYFIILLVVKAFISKYESSLPLTGVLITSIPGILIIKSIYVNSYKVLKKERDFLITAAIMTFLSIGLSIILYLIFKTMISIAFAAVIIIYLWTLFPPKHLKITIKQRLMEAIYLFIMVAGFVLLISSPFSFAGKIVSSALSLILLNMIFYRKHSKELASMFMNKIYQMIR